MLSNQAEEHIGAATAGIGAKLLVLCPVGNPQPTTILSWTESMLWVHFDESKADEWFSLLEGEHIIGVMDSCVGKEEHNLVLQDLLRKRQHRYDAETH